MIALSKKNVFAGKRNFSLNKTKKEKKTFLWKVWINADVYTRKGKKRFFVMNQYVYLTSRYYTTSHLHQVFFRFRTDFLAFVAGISYFKIFGLIGI